MMSNINTWEDCADEAEPLIDFLNDLWHENPNILVPVHIEAGIADWLRQYRRTVDARRVNVFEENAVAVG